jgi:hypothetical protein
VKKHPVREQSKMYVVNPDGSGVSLVRVRHCPERPLKNGKGIKAARYVLRCGCCKNGRVEIFYDREQLEINGVEGSIENWRAILLPLLGINPNNVPSNKMKRAQRNLARLRAKYAVIGVGEGKQPRK